MGRSSGVVLRLDSTSTHPSAHPALQHLDPSTAWLYAPHTVTTLLLGLLLLGYYGGVLGPQHAAGADVTAGSSSGGGSSNAAAGVWAAILVFLGYSVVQGPRTSMVRPHPAVWRLVHGAAVVYVLLLVWLLFQSVHDARQFLKHLSPSLGVEVAYRDYGDHCALLTPDGRVAWSNLRSTLLDEFVIAHSLGWWAKALLLRNTTLLWMYSVSFELMEATFAHMLPNFNECWWDSWLLDVAICNSLGIYAGMASVRWLECTYTNYNWQGISELSGLLQRASRGLQQLLPYSWTKLDWMVFSSPKRCLASLAVVAAFLLVELNVFFLKFALWVPPTNPLNTARLLLWLLVGAPAVREYFEFVSGASGSAPVVRGGLVFHKLGTFAWLAGAMLALETMIAVKFGRGLYPAPWPSRVLVAWALAGSAFLGGMSAWQLVVWRSQRQAAAGKQGGRRQPPVQQQQQQQQEKRRLPKKAR